LHRSLSLLLHDNRAGGDMTALDCLGPHRGREARPDHTRATCCRWQG
jgi:hypothetical protein